jgi:sugar phosphate isomerase/epimerase
LEKMSKQKSRREFLKNAASLTGATVMGSLLPRKVFAHALSNQIPLSGHVWVYASQFPPHWDCTPIMDQVMADFKYAGLEGVELMDSNLRRDDIVSTLTPLMEKHEIPITGTSYYGDMWDRSRYSEILEDAEMILSRLHALGGSTIGITVGDAGHIKTASELDAQAEVLQKILKLCKQYSVQPNLHNHTFEVENDLHDLKGILERIPDMPLGPDINWLIRGGVDPVWFIETYGHQMDYLHLRDQGADGKWTRALGEGVTDFPAIARALERVNFSGRAAVELAFETPVDNKVREDWRKSRDYVSEVFKW